MGSLAIIAKEKGFQVSGSDKALYPPMSNQLARANVEVFEGFDPSQLRPRPDLVIVGNAELPRGHEAIEHILNENLPYTSGAEWLGNEVLQDRWVIAIAGTHGKTTTTSMVAWILEYAGLAPGYLIGGAPKNFERSARLGSDPFFVVEADEYDTSYFDRRSKFVHYRPRTLVINNLEYDHADIFNSLEEIQTQFHHLVRTVPSQGLIITPRHQPSIEEILHQGIWTPIARFGAIDAVSRPLELDNGELWHAEDAEMDGSSFNVHLNERDYGRVEWSLIGEHNIANALSAIAASRHAGVDPHQAVQALCRFKGVRRRMELFANHGGLRVYDDFAHHPTAIQSTLQGLRNSVGNERILAVVEPGTHTMSLGTLRDALTRCCAPANEAIWFRGKNILWDLGEVVQNSVVPASLEDNIDRLVDRITQIDQLPCHVVIMSNGSFGGVYEKLLAKIEPAE